MLTRLLPDQIAKHWDIIKQAIEESLPPTAYKHQDYMSDILTSLLTERAQCWLSYFKNEGKIVLEGVVVTKLILDDVSMTRNLLIYSLYGYIDFTKDTWISGFNSLIKYARSKGCKQLIAYTIRDSIIEVAKLAKAEISTFIKIDIDKTDKLFNELGG